MCRAWTDVVGWNLVWSKHDSFMIVPFLPDHSRRRQHGAAYIVRSELRPSVHSSCRYCPRPLPGTTALRPIHMLAIRSFSVLVSRPRSLPATRPSSTLSGAVFSLANLPPTLASGSGLFAAAPSLNNIINSSSGNNGIFTMSNNINIITR